MQDLVKDESMLIKYPYTIQCSGCTNGERIIIYQGEKSEELYICTKHHKPTNQHNCEFKELFLED